MWEKMRYCFRRWANARFDAGVASHIHWSPIYAVCLLRGQQARKGSASSQTGSSRSDGSSLRVAFEGQVNWANGLKRLTESD
uniref:Uncharacterized protein n=1 Tax=Bionectria ochroleuca TaxID=29856 RepID=A0A0B7K986_BIOOC